MIAFFKKRVLLWPLILSGVIVVALVIAAAAFGAFNAFSVQSIFSTKSETRDSQVVAAIEQKQEVALLSLGIQGIKSKEDGLKFFGSDIFGSSRATYLQYEFTAKIGVDGEQVKVDPQGDTVVVSIPGFIWIGVDDVKYDFVMSKDGILSFVTPEIDRDEMINSILSDEVKEKYLDKHDEALRDQVEVFYSGIIHAVDPTLDIEFVYTGGASADE
ncbi:hypothetical protein [Microbacterium sp.]|uniref:hypothetical protein n=1 Tax=Microbacterium sp. TaxID=51671 RepID=UPI0039E264E4